jgi:3-oxoadipate enol-lactonase / 4-carboxymuconolactone decarboxylase
MPHIDVNDCVLHYHLQGPEHAPVVVFSNGLGTTTAMWQPQLQPIEGRYRILRSDTRGHGHSAAPAGPYSVEILGNDVLALASALQIEKFHFCGLSMGGQVGQWLIHNAPERLHSATLANTALKIGTDEGWNSRIMKVMHEGMIAVAAAVTDRWFTPGFTAKCPDAVAKMRTAFLGIDPKGYAACCAAVRDANFENVTAAAKLPPVLVICGTKDQATSAADGHKLAESLPGAKFIDLEAAHLSSVEAHSQFTDALLTHVAQAEQQNQTKAEA